MVEHVNQRQQALLDLLCLPRDTARGQTELAGFVGLQRQAPRDERRVRPKEPPPAERNRGVAIQSIGLSIQSTALKTHEKRMKNA